jgi:hypothetical protein
MEDMSKWSTEKLKKEYSDLYDAYYNHEIISDANIKRMGLIFPELSRRGLVKVL